MIKAKTKQWCVAATIALAILGFGRAARAEALTGAGSTFINPLMQKWQFEYTKSHPDLKINYQSIGSGGGIKQISEKTVDFGATDGPMTEQQLSKAPGILHVPVAMGAVVPIYNL